MEYQQYLDSSTVEINQAVHNNVSLSEISPVAGFSSEVTQDNPALETFIKELYQDDLLVNLRTSLKTECISQYMPDLRSRAMLFEESFESALEALGPIELFKLLRLSTDLILVHYIIVWQY